MEKQIMRAVNKLYCEGRYVGNPVLAAAAEVFLREYDAGRQLPTASNGAAKASAYVPPHIPGKGS